MRFSALWGFDDGTDLGIPNVWMNSRMNYSLIVMISPAERYQTGSGAGSLLLRRSWRCLCRPVSWRADEPLAC